ncbi:MAG: hypothetical protein PHW01_02365 [Patescibacteria group bacterium]|nr:hypothetical protein [Patescibacteria group bacterium]
MKKILGVMGLLFLMISNFNVFAEETKSFTVCYHTVFSCLNSAEKITGIDPSQWKSITNRQKQTLELHQRFGEKDLKQFKPEEMEGFASYEPCRIAEFLTQKGFTDLAGSVKNFSAPNFGTVAVMKVNVHWVEKGGSDWIEYQQKWYQAATLPEGVISMELPGTEAPIFRIETQEGDFAYIALIPYEGKDQKGLEAEISKVIVPFIKGNIEETDQEMAITFPVVKYDGREDISWLVGINAIGKDKIPTELADAQMQNKLVMDHEGASVESAAFMRFARGSSRARAFQIKQPFLVWFSRPGMNLPYFIGYIAPDSWVVKE